MSGELSTGLPRILFGPELFPVNETFKSLCSLRLSRMMHTSYSYLMPNLMESTVGCLGSQSCLTHVHVDLIHGILDGHPSQREEGSGHISSLGRGGRKQGLHSFMVMKLSTWYFCSDRSGHQSSIVVHFPLLCLIGASLTPMQLGGIQSTPIVLCQFISIWLQKWGHTSCPRVLTYHRGDSIPEG